MEEGFLENIEKIAKKAGIDIQGVDFDGKQFLDGIGAALKQPTEKDKDTEDTDE